MSVSMYLKIKENKTDTTIKKHKYKEYNKQKKNKKKIKKK
jgi:hypothetical protein